MRASLTTGNSNIDVGNVGKAGDANKIRIGTQGTQNGTFIAGISGVSVTGAAPVEVSSTGQLGIVMSSARYKRDIRDMGAGSGALLKLRPVTFRYKDDPAGTLQYGLVAEEVAKIYPELVAYGPDGKVMTVRYSMLSAMLLNELQKQAQASRRQAEENQRQARRIEQLSTQMAAHKELNDQKIAQLQTNQDRELRAMRAGFEQRLSTLERATRAGAVPAALKF
jgi:hypothetical protein